MTPVRFDTFAQDLRSAWRSIAKSPGFAVTVVLTFALGLGLNSATFSLLDRLYLRAPEGVTDPGGIRRIWFDRSSQAQVTKQTMTNQPYPVFRALGRILGDSSTVAVTNRQSALLGGTLSGYSTRLTFATPSYFTLLGVRPGMGRFYSADENHPGAGVAVPSHRFWREHLGADTSIVGKPIRLGQYTYTVIGIAPRGFEGIELEPVDVWIPIGDAPQPPWMKERLLDSYSMWTFDGFMRLPPGMDLTAIEKQASLELREVRGPGVALDTGFAMHTGAIIRAQGPGEVGKEHTISTRLSGVSMIVLVISCANVVNLLLARAVRRRREIAVRLAVGISRGRLVRLLTTETLLLALMAAVGALVAGWWGGKFLRSLTFPDNTWADPVMHWRVAVFTVGIALLAGLLTGIVPALQYSRPNLVEALKEGGSAVGVHRSRLRNGLLIAQAALSLVLLAGAGLFIRSLHNVQGKDVGFDARQLLFARMMFEDGQSPPEAELASTIRGLEAELKGKPGIEAVARVGMEPMRGMAFYNFYWGPGGADSSGSLRSSFPILSTATPEFFPAAGVQLLEGRHFGDRAPGETVVNTTMAATLWPNRPALGECIYLGKRTNPCLSVVGVVETVLRGNITESPAPQFYIPAGTNSQSEAVTLMVRTSPGSGGVARREVEALLRRSYPRGVPRLHAMSETLEPQYRPWRLGAVLFTALGLLALIVAAVGIYSTTSYSVGQRVREFGLRVALGATTGDVLRLVIGEGLQVIVIGVVTGILLVLATGKLITALLYGVQPANPMIIIAAAIVLLLASVIAALVPAWRGARTDPGVALRLT